jgi:hypothetical protein
MASLIHENTNFWLEVTNVKQKYRRSRLIIRKGRELYKTIKGNQQVILLTADQLIDPRISTGLQIYQTSYKGMVRSDMSKPALIFFSLQEYTQQNPVSKF